MMKSLSLGQSSRVVHSASAGFTFVEVLVVVLLLAILAIIVVPQFSNASTAARANMLADDLRIIRTQISIFKAQHRGVAPGYPDCDLSAEPTEAAFIMHMTQSSKGTGEAAPLGTEGFPYGPYFGRIPANPFSDKSTVQIIPDSGIFPGCADNSHGWIYQPSTLTIKADYAGRDDSGKAYFDY